MRRLRCARKYEVYAWGDVSDLVVGEAAKLLADRRRQMGRFVMHGESTEQNTLGLCPAPLYDLPV